MSKNRSVSTLARDVKEQYFLVNVYVRGLARSRSQRTELDLAKDVKEQYFLVNVYVRGLAREVKEQNLVNVYARGLAREVRQRTALSGQCLRSRACPRCQITVLVLSSQCLHRMSMQEQYSLVNVYARRLEGLPEMSKNSTFWSMFTCFKKNVFLMGVVNDL